MFSQYGEVMDVNMPKDKETAKSRGFAFLMYEDQRSTILAVDNLNGATLLDKTLRVDHVQNYKQKRVKGEDGEWHDPEDQSLNAKPEIIDGQCIHNLARTMLIYCSDDAASDSEGSSVPSINIDPEDPMRDYLLSKHREEKLKGKKGKKSKHEGETAEERKARKEKKRAKKEKKRLEGRSARRSSRSPASRR